MRFLAALLAAGGLLAASIPQVQASPTTQYSDDGSVWYNGQRWNCGDRGWIAIINQYGNVECVRRDRDGRRHRDGEVIYGDVYYQGQRFNQNSCAPFGLTLVWDDGRPQCR